MLKPDSLRRALTEGLVDAAGVRFLERDPHRLAIFIDKGRIAGRATGSIGFEWRYRLQAILTDFPASLVDSVALVVMLWLREHQPETLLNHTSGNDAVIFEADIIDADTIDLALELELNEAVDARPRDTGGFDLVHRAEPNPTPPFDDVPDTTPIGQFYLGDALIFDNTPPLQDG
jgi:hypothetical protein